MLPDQTIHIVAFQQNLGTLRHKLGHPEAKMGDEFDFSVFDLTDGCNLPVKVICDYCGKEFTVPLAQRNYRLNMSPAHKDCCSDYACRAQKKAETSLARFGTTTPQSLPEVIDKVRATDIKKYGCHHTKAESVIAKKNQTLNEKYGPDWQSSFILRLQQKALEEHGDPRYYWDSPEVKAKRAQTNIEKYGVPSALQSEEVRTKILETCRERYGVDNPMFVQEFAEKATANRSYDTISCSAAEKTMVGFIKELGYDAHPEYANLGYVYDCAVFCGEHKIDVEYDGRFWHDQKPGHDTIRDNKTIKDGWQVIRFRGDVDPPTKEQVKAALDAAILENQLTQVIELAG